MSKTRQWAIFTAVAVLVVLAGGWMLLVSPQRSHAKDLDAQAASAQSQVSSLHAQLAQLLAQKRNLPEQQRLLAQIATKIPSDPQEPTLIRELQGAAHTAGVDLTTLSPSTPTEVTAAASTPTTTSGSSAPATASQLWQMPVTIGVQGSYFNVEQFEYSLEKLPRALLVSGETLTPATGGPGESDPGSSTTAVPGDVTANISATVYLSPRSTTSAPTTDVAGSGSAAMATH